MKQIILSFLVLVILSWCSRSDNKWFLELNKCKERWGVHIQYILSHIEYPDSRSYYYLCMPKWLSIEQLSIPYSGMYDGYKTTVKILSE